MTKTNNNPWEDFPEIWKNKSAYFTWLRGNLRKIWNTSPQKTEFIKKYRKQIPNPNPKGNKKYVWGAKCNFCNKDFPMKDLQVDHIISAGSINDWEDVEGFVRRLLGSGEGELRFLCKPCHATLSYSERHGLTFNQAWIKKEVISFTKRFTVARQKSKLKGVGACDQDVSNEKNRKSFYERYLLNNGDKL